MHKKFFRTPSFLSDTDGKVDLRVLPEVVEDLGEEEVETQSTQEVSRETGKFSPNFLQHKSSYNLCCSSIIYGENFQII